MTSPDKRRQPTTSTLRDTRARRQRAEALALGKAATSFEKIDALSLDTTRAMLHELHVHQIELEMQNEELRQAQMELDTERARYFDLYDLAPVGYCTVDADGLIQQANLTAAALLGQPRRALVKQRISRYIFKEDQDVYYLLRQQLIKSGEPQSRELRMLKGDGTTFWAHLAASVALDASGVPSCRIVLNDISERMQAQQALQDSEQRYRTLLEELHFGVILHGPKTEIMLANVKAMELLGLTQEQLLGKTSFDPDWRVTHEDGTPFPGQPHPAALAAATGQPVHGVVMGVYRTRTKDPVWLLVNAEPQLNPDGSVRLVVVTFDDITSRRQEQEQLRIAATAFECQEGIVVMDADLKILRVNQAFSQMTGYAEPYVQGKLSVMLRSKRFAASFFDTLWQDVQRTGSWQGEGWHQRKDSEDFPVRCTITAVRNAHGQVTHYVGFLTDISNEKQQELQRLRDETAHRNILVREVHHRIKNNLQGIMGILRKFANRHPDMADPMQQAISQVQTISVIHGLLGRAVTASVLLCDLLRAIASEIEDLWQTPIELDIAPGWDLHIVAEDEAVPIALVLNELILNAVKHGGQANRLVRITLHAGEQAGQMHIDIDNAGHFAADRRHAGLAHSGLHLITALMPRIGARIMREQRGEHVVTVLELESPVIFLETKETECLTKK